MQDYPMTLARNGFQLPDRRDLVYEHFEPSRNFDRSTKADLTTEPPLLCGCHHALTDSHSCCTINYIKSVRYFLCELLVNNLIVKKAVFNYSLFILQPNNQFRDRTPVNPLGDPDVIVAIKEVNQVFETVVVKGNYPAVKQWGYVAKQFVNFNKGFFVKIAFVLRQACPPQSAVRSP